MPLTKEERAQRAKQRELEREKEEQEQSRKYPPAMLDRRQDRSEWIQVLLDFRNPNFLRVRWTGDVFSNDLPFIGVKAASIPLDNLAQLAAMIRGLVMRYNAMVQDLNEEIGATPPMEAAKTFKPDGGQSQPAAASENGAATDSV
jgi:hypothetical protein